jgi:predicted alpha/beta-hydrolase family hydrolase
MEPISSRGVRGFVHHTGGSPADGLVLTHGAGSNANAPFLIEIAAAFADAGITVLRCDLPFRQLRPHGPPFPAMAPRDRAGLVDAIALIRTIVPGKVFLGGHSYGGRQSTMAAAEDPELASALLVLSYPLHPPRKREELRTAHFPKLQTPAVFVHGSRDPFGSIEEMHQALALIPARTNLVEIPEGSHDLAVRKRGRGENIPAHIIREFLAFVRT